MADEEKVAGFVSNLLSNFISDAVVNPLIKPIGSMLFGWLKDRETQKTLLIAARNAENDFRRLAMEKFGNDRLTQAVASFPIYNGGLFQSALQNLPSHFDETFLESHLSSDLLKNWRGEFSPEEIRAGIALYLDCLRVQLLRVNGFAEIVTRLATLRTDRRNEEIYFLVKDIRGIVSALPSQLSQTLEIHDTIGHRPPHRMNHYVSRGDIEQAVVACLKAGGTGAIVGINAPGGLGKTELAKHVSAVLEEEFNGNYLWVDIGDSNPEQAIDALIRKLNIQLPSNSNYETKKNEVHHALMARQKMMIVFDDVRSAAKHYSRISGRLKIVRS
jgi:hypothetical protein